MKGAFQSNQPALPCLAALRGGTRELDCAFNGLSAAVRKENPVQPGKRAQLLRQPALILVAIEIGGVNHARGLLADHFHNARVRVTKGIHPQPTDEIEITPAFHVIDEDALAAADRQWIAAVGGQQELTLELDDFLK